MDESIRVFRLEEILNLNNFHDIERLVIGTIRYKFPWMFYFTEHGFLDYKIYLVAPNYKSSIYPRLKFQVDNKSRIFIFNEVAVTGYNCNLGERSAGYKYLGTRCIGDKDFSDFIFFNPQLESLKSFLTYKYELKNKKRVLIYFSFFFNFPQHLYNDEEDKFYILNIHISLGRKY